MSAASCWPGSRCGLPLSFPCRAPRPPGWILHGPLPKPITLSPAGDALHLVPRIGVLGIGCRRGTCAEQLEAAFTDFCARHSLAPACITAVASIDLKADEAGLLAFCRTHGWPITFYSAEQLRALPGPFTPSPFVQSVTGVDNVCERAAVLASGGCIRIPKQAGGGVTFALALCPYAPDWRWQNG